MTMRLGQPPRASSFRSFLWYVAVFHLGWIAWPFLVYPRLAALGETTLVYAIFNIGIRLLVWVAPVLIYLRDVDGLEPFGYLKLKENVPRGLLVAVGLTLLNLAGSSLRFGPPHLAAQRVTWNSVFGTSMLVGFIEEIPYRGFMLQKFAERVGFLAASVITSILFVAIHVPGWIALGMWRTTLALTIFVFGLVMAWAFKFARSLWAPIVAHSANDFLSFMLFGS
jgi:membrane protease YdiL (CAAX protease family)